MGSAYRRSVPSFGLIMWTLLLIIFGAIPIVFITGAFLDAARRPQWIWAFAERVQVFWLGVLLFGTFVMPLGLPFAAWYWLRVRRELQAVEAGNFGEAMNGL